MIKRSLLNTLKTISALGLSLLLVYSCHEKKKGSFSVTGTFKNADKLASAEGPVSKVILMEVPYGKDQSPVVLDSVKISGNNGSFSLTGTAKSQEVYALVFGNNVLEVPLVNDVPEVKVNVDLGKKDDFYEASGSDATTQLKDLITIFGKKNFEVERSMAELDSLKQGGAVDSVQLAATTRKNSNIQDLNTYLKQFINTNGNATVCALALSWSSRSFTKEDFEASLNDLLKKYPANAVILGLKQNYEQQLAQMAERQQSTSWVGKPAPDLALPDANGRPIPLTSYKGKYVLVDFWASWCGPCRGENPNVVKAYSEFKNKNFAILGVSLDKDKDAWLQAVREDKLEWSQVSDLKYWNSKAVEIFKFDGIPYNILIDPQGKIIAEKLRGDDLENKLKEVLAK